MGGMHHHQGSFYTQHDDGSDMQHLFEKRRAVRIVVNKSRRIFPQRFGLESLAVLSELHEDDPPPPTNDSSTLFRMYLDRKYWL